ncbi:MAG TPA: CU044_5270 family protein [Acidimicrobiales bacterium]
MTELDERIRSFFDLNASPVSVEEVLALGAGRASDVAPRQRPRRRRLLAMCGASAAVLALVSVGLIVIPGPKNVNVPTASAATFLDSAAQRATHEKALVPGPGQYLYVVTISSMGNGASGPPSFKMYWYDSEELAQTWTSPSEQSHESFKIVGRPMFVSAADRAAWILDGATPLGSGNSSGPPPPYYGVTSLPTKASAMVAYFKSQTDLPKQSPGESAPSWEFSTVLGFLQNGASSTQRAALLRFAATIPGIRLMGHATSVVTNQTGLVIGFPIGGGTGRVEEAIFDPSNSTLIETRLVLNALPAKASPFPEPTPFIGEIESYTDFIFAGDTGANSGYSLPAHTPTFPKAWPFTLTRQPLPGSIQSKSS